MKEALVSGIKILSEDLILRITFFTFNRKLNYAVAFPTLADLDPSFD